MVGFFGAFLRLFWNFDSIFGFDLSGGMVPVGSTSGGMVPVGSTSGGIVPVGSTSGGMVPVG